MSDSLLAKEAKPTNSSKGLSKTKSGGLAIGILVFLWAFWMGWSGGKNKPESDDDWKDKTIAPRVAVLRQQLKAIEGRPVHTVEDYISNTLETEPIVNEAHGLIAKQMVMITEFKLRHDDNSGDMKAADYMMKLTKADAQLMDLLGDEIRCAKDLNRMPHSRRLAYYNATVPAIKDREEQAVKDYFAVANDATANGIPLPAGADKAGPEPSNQ